ncbi:MAG: VWA domain-containing protein [Firmicutes bacterium]|nr:VWA domain-containing protein [Bacillota bacterium]
MKTVKKAVLLTLILVLAAVLFAGCEAGAYLKGASPDGAPGGGGSYKGGGSAADSPAADGSSYDPSAPPLAPGEDGGLGESPSDSGKKPPQIQSGQLTAAEWNDLRNYDFWQGLVSPADEQQQRQKGVFSDFLEQWNLETRYRVPVKVTCEGAPVSGAEVRLFGDKDKLLYCAMTDARGEAYLFPQDEPGDCRVTASADEIFLSSLCMESVDFTYEPDMEPIEIELWRNRAKPEIIELMFVIDTTGSMGDEIAYLRAELVDVVSRASEATGAQIKLAILLYKDKGDVYVTQYYDFTTDLSAQQKVLNSVKASGGGDYPEAVDIALSEAASKQWSSANTTKLIFHVLDAPPHDGQGNKTLFKSSILKAAELGIRMIPVASSGVDKLTEFLLRSEAMLTGGTYTFLTDDSGIGGSHLEPTCGPYVVEYLNALMLRLITEYYTGVAGEPVAWQGQG